METPEKPEQMPPEPESAGGSPVPPGEAENPLPPRPRKKSPWSTAINVTAIVTAIAGGLFILTGMPGRTLGATRSYRLKCEQRQQQMEAAAREDALAAPDATKELNKGGRN